jgi:hypothetical protein
MTTETTGDRELALRFETFPTRARAKLVDRITSLTERLHERVDAAMGRFAHPTGKLQSEITSRVYADNPNRIAGYVEIYAPDGGSNEYAKAATLEYGTDKVRRAFERTGGLLARLGGARRRIIERASKPVHIEAFRYLRGPFADLEDEMYAELNAALAEAAQE